MKKGIFSKSFSIGLSLILVFLFWGCVEEIGIVDPNVSLLGEGSSLLKSGEIQYVGERLGALEAGGLSAVWRGLNDYGQIAGPSGSQAFVWTEGTGMEALTQLADDCVAFDLNNDGIVVGYCTNYVTVEDFPVVWENGSYVVLNLGSFSNGRASSINDGGRIIGSVEGISKGVIWENFSSEPEELQPLENHQRALAEGINNLGDVAGFSSQTNETSAVVWLNGETSVYPKQLPQFGSAVSSQVFAINDDRDAVGRSGSDTYVFWRYIDNETWADPIELHGLRGFLDISNRDENGMVTIVGEVGNRAGYSRVDVSTGDIYVQELPLPDGVHHRRGTSTARGVNADGWIAGVSRDHNNPEQATLWRPVEVDDDPDDGDNGDDEDDDHCPPGWARQGRC